jgi:mannose-6-phosphate isomerase-like protein (cupin superfamily)
MPRIIKKKDIQCHLQIPGFQIKSVTETFNQDSKVLEVKLLILDSNIISPEFTHNDIDQLLYVIKGDGIATVNSEEFPLDKESILWLESGEKYHFISGGLGLEILQATAPCSIN